MMHRNVLAIAIAKFGPLWVDFVAKVPNWPAPIFLL